MVLCENHSVVSALQVLVHRRGEPETRHLNRMHDQEAETFTPDAIAEILDLSRRGVVIDETSRLSNDPESDDIGQ